MELRDWLSAVAQRNGSTPAGVKHYHGFAGNIRKDFPRLICTDATAFAVGSMLGGQFPTWDELRNAIRAVITEAASGKPDTEEARMTALWVGYYRRRLQDKPGSKWRLQSLLRKVDMAAFREIDDGFWQQCEDDFDRQFWEDRGGHTHHDPADYRDPAETISRVAIGYPRANRTPLAAPKPAGPPSGALRDSVLVAQYRAMAEAGNEVAIARLATLEAAK